MVFIKEIGTSNDEAHLDNVENKTRSGIADFTRHIYSRAGQDTNSVLASPRDTDPVSSGAGEDKGKRWLSPDEVAREEKLRKAMPITENGERAERTVDLINDNLRGGMRRGDAGTSGDQRIGKQIGEYRLRQVLGQGSFARVYLGDNVDSRKPPAAVKVLNIPLIGPEANQFFAEVQALERLKHENIVKIYKYGVEDIEHRYPYLALEYAHHGSLEDYHRQNTPSYPRLPWGQIAEHLDQLAPPLDFAHNIHNIVHRDLKPANLLVVKMPNGEIVIKIGDLGLALVFQKTTSRRTQGFAGTIEYAAPEQLMGKPGPESDLYAVGIMTYEWLSGHLPFQGTLMEIMSQQMLKAPDPIPGIAQAIQDVVFHALAKDPKQRKQHFKSVAEFAREFRRASGIPAPSQRAEASSSRPVQNRAQDRPPVPAIVSPLRAEASSSRPVRDQLAEMRLQDTSDRSIFHNPKRLTLIRTLGRHKGTVRALAVHNGHLISGGCDGAIKVWNSNTGKYLNTLEGHRGTVCALAAHNGYLISGSDDNTIKVWDLNTGKCLNTLEGHKDLVGALAAHNGHLISGSDDNTIKVWDLNTGKCLNTLEGHKDLVGALAVHNGHLISGSGDKTIKVWDLNTGKCLNTLEGHRETVCALAVHNGHLISGSADNTIKVWGEK
jgi:serine/threonine protein kinase